MSEASYRVTGPETHKYTEIIPLRPFYHFYLDVMVKCECVCPKNRRGYLSFSVYIYTIYVKICLIMLIFKYFEYFLNICLWSAFRNVVQLLVT